MHNVSTKKPSTSFWSPRESNQRQIVLNLTCHTSSSPSTKLYDRSLMRSINDPEAEFDATPPGHVVVVVLPLLLLLLLVAVAMVAAAAAGVNVRLFFLGYLEKS